MIMRTARLEHMATMSLSTPALPKKSAEVLSNSMALFANRLGGRTVRLALTLLFIVVAFAHEPTMSQAVAGEQTGRGDWQEAYKSRTRLLAGDMPDASAGKELYAGVELRLAPKWKTYWRSPGEAGGVPPTFDWAASKNIKDVEVVYPAPVRLVAGYGENIGYQSEVIFPVRLTVVDLAKPIELNLDFIYGACEDICVPANVNLSLVLAPGARPPIPPGLLAALTRVPRLASSLTANDPRIVSSEFVLSGDKPHLSLDIAFGGDDVAADVFVEGPGGSYIPMSRRVKDKDPAPGTARFEIDLSKDVELADLKGKKLRVTIVGDRGQSEYELTAN